MARDSSESSGGQCSNVSGHHLGARPGLFTHPNLKPPSLEIEMKTITYGLKKVATQSLALANSPADCVEQLCF
jgi:hypothetical protein